MNHVSPQPTFKLPHHADEYNLVGQVRRFGQYGVLYEVIGIASIAEAVIHVITTGEETTYPIAHILNDPLD